MRITTKTRRQLLVQNLLYYGLLVLITALVAWLSMRYSIQGDWSANNRNTLSQVSRDAARKINGPVHITAFVADDDMTRAPVRTLIGRYQRYKPDIELEFVNPQTNPARSREMNVTGMGELIIEHGAMQERLQQLNEQTFTNALQRLARGGERWIVFLTGHGERDPYAQDNNGLSTFTERATQQGFSMQSLNLVAEQSIPDNTKVVVIAGPQRDYLPGETGIVLDYVRRGGNLLWLTEPEHASTLQPLAKELGIKRLPGVVVDSAGQIFGITRPDFVLVVNYPDKDFMRDFNEFTLFPQATGLVADAKNPLGLVPVIFLQTLARSWTETGPIEGNIEFDDNSAEVAGPIDIGIRLTRGLQQGEEPNSATQRIAVVGDSDFMTNAYVGNGSNMLLGINLLNWLSHDDDLISIDAVSAPDTQLELNPNTVSFISVLFLLALPLILFGIGITIWLQRRKR